MSKTKYKVSSYVSNVGFFVEEFCDSVDYFNKVESFKCLVYCAYPDCVPDMEIKDQSLKYAKKVCAALNNMQKSNSQIRNDKQSKTKINNMFQVKIIDSYQLYEYERVMEEVNQFCQTHEVVEVKSDVKKDNVIYSIVYKVNQNNTK